MDDLCVPCWLFSDGGLHLPIGRGHLAYEHQSVSPIFRTFVFLSVVNMKVVTLVKEMKAVREKAVIL